MSGKKEKRSDITKGLLWPIAVIVLAFWLVSMVLVTYMGVKMTKDQFYTHFYQVESELSQHMVETEGGAVYDALSYYPAFDTFDRYLPIGVIRPDPRNYYAVSMQVGNGYYVTTPDGEPVLTQDGEPIYEVDVIQGDGDLLFFRYSQSTDGAEGQAVIGLEETDFGRALARELAEGDRRDGILDTGIDGWTGYFEGHRFHLVEVVDWPEDMGPGTVDPEDRGWVRTVGAEAPGQELVTLYPEEVRYHLAYRGSVTVGGRTFGSLEELHEVYEKKGWRGFGGKVWHGCYYYAEDLVPEDHDGGDCVDTVMYYRPVAYTLAQIWPVYIITLLLAVAVLALYRRWICRDVVAPAREMIRQEGEVDPSSAGRKCWGQLQEVFGQLRARIRELDRENGELRASLDQVKDAEAQRKKSVSHISHELKTPLAIIHSYAEGLAEGIAGEKRDQYLDVILDETENMDALVLEMLDHSRMEAGQVRLRPERFSLTRLTRQILEVLEPLIRHRDLVLETRMLEELQIVADEARIAQAIRNLVSNAIKYTRPGGRIWIEVCRQEDKTLFSIENQCDPLSGEELEGIWRSYYRTETSPKANGTGLGLPIVKAIIELHGGSCTAENTDQGVKFHFVL